jgi:hypothetical protein
MRDVFKYFKQVRDLQESTTSERAHELGYEYQARGVWMDPKDGKRYKAQGDRFIPMPEKEVTQRGPGQQQDPKSLDQFRQDATGGQQPQAEPTALPQIPDGLSDEEFADSIAKQNTGGRKVTPKRKEFLKKAAATQVAMMKQPEEPAPEEEGDEEIPAGLDDVLSDVRGEGEPEKKEVDDFPTIDDKVTEKEQELDDLDDDEAFEAEYDKFQQDLENTMKELTERQRKMMEKKFGKFQESLKNIPSAVNKKSFLQSMAHAKTFEGRVNSGAGKNNLGYADVQNLMANRDRLVEGYGDGSPEQIKKFVQSVRSNEVSDEFVDASFDVLPETFKKSLKGKGQVTNDKYVSDDKAHKDMHYLGKNPDGTVKRGMASTNERAKLMWRIYLEQGGRDAYTGLPLDIQAMDLEHVRGFNNKDGGNPGKEEWEQRENDDNMTLINSNINQKKVDMSMKDFFEREVDPHKDKSEDDFGGIEKLFDKQNEIGSVGDELVKTLLGEGGKGLGNEITKDILLEHFSADDTRYTDLRDEFRRVATDDKDKKKAAGMKSKLGKTLLKATGLSRGITDPSGRRTVALQENVYRGFLQSMAGAKPEDRQAYMDGWAQAIKAGNDERSPKAVNRTLVELGLIDQDILDDRKSGRVFREELRYLDRMKGRNMIESLKKSLRNPI